MFSWLDPSDFGKLPKQKVVTGEVIPPENSPAIPAPDYEGQFKELTGHVLKMADNLVQLNERVKALEEIPSLPQAVIVRQLRAGNASTNAASLDE